MQVACVGHDRVEQDSGFCLHNNASPQKVLTAGELAGEPAGESGRGGVASMPGCREGEFSVYASHLRAALVRGFGWTAPLRGPGYQPGLHPWKGLQVGQHRSLPGTRPSGVPRSPIIPQACPLVKQTQCTESEWCWRDPGVTDLGLSRPQHFSAICANERHGRPTLCNGPK